MGAQLLSHPEGVTLEGGNPVDRSEVVTMCMDTLLLRVWSMPLSLGESGWSCVSTSPSLEESSAKKGGDVYAPMSTIKQSLSVVMPDKVETLLVNSSRWNGGWEIPP